MKKKLFWDLPCLKLSVPECFRTKACHLKTSTAQKVSVLVVFLVRIFPHFGLNTENYCVNVRIQSEFGEIQIKKSSNTNTFCAA